MSLKWKDVYSEAELLKAALKLYTKPLYAPRKGHTKSHDNVTIYDFALSTPKNLQILHRQLAGSTFTYEPGLVRTIRTRDKTKNLYIYPWREKIVDAMLYHILTRQFNNFFSKKSYAYKPTGSGVDICQYQIQKFLRKWETVYVIKRDISSFFPSINHEVLLGQIQEIIDDPFLLKLISQRIKFQYFNDKNELLTADVGVPFGTPIACFLANLYLDSTDKIFDHDDTIGYFRYADDFIIATPSREKALWIIEQFEKQVESLKVTCKPSHSLNLVLTQDKLEDSTFTVVSKFKHLGLEYRADGSLGLSRDKIRKILNLIKRKFKHSKRRYQKLPSDEKLQKLINLVNEVVTERIKSVSIIDYYLKHVTDEKQLRLIDRYIAETILSEVTGRGYKRSNFKLIPYKELREKGLISLVHRKRLLTHGHIDSSFFNLRNEAKEQRYEKRLEKRRLRVEAQKQRRQDRKQIPKEKHNEN